MTCLGSYDVACAVLRVGNLYYALTHSPEPLTEEYSHALSWEAATERFIAAGSISVAEAEAMEEALSSAAAGIDVRVAFYFISFQSGRGDTSDMSYFSSRQLD